MTRRIIHNLFLLVVFVISASNGLRLKEGDQGLHALFGTEQPSDVLSGAGLDAPESTPSLHTQNITLPPHNISSGDDIAWGQGGLSDSSSDSSYTSGGASHGSSEIGPGNNTMSESTESAPKHIATSAFLFVSIPLIALAAAIASKYGKSSNENEASRNPHDLEDNYSSHRMITAASEEEEEGSTSPGAEDKCSQDSELMRTERALSESILDRKLFVQVYKPHRDQSELAAIKNGLAMALNDRGSPAIRGSGRYNLTGRNAYTPDDDSEHNSPFDEPSMPI